MNNLQNIQENAGSGAQLIFMGCKLKIPKLKLLRRVLCYDVHMKQLPRSRIKNGSMRNGTMTFIDIPASNSTALLVAAYVPSSSY